MVDNSQQFTRESQHCPATRKDGRPCTASSGPSGYCIGHSPNAIEARRQGGRGRSRVARAGKLLPERLKPVAESLETALKEVHDGRIDPRIATAMASLAGALGRVFQAGELEERLRQLEVMNHQVKP